MYDFLPPLLCFHYKGHYTATHRDGVEWTTHHRCWTLCPLSTHNLCCYYTVKAHQISSSFLAYCGSLLTRSRYAQRQQIISCNGEVSSFCNQFVKRTTLASPSVANFLCNAHRWCPSDLSLRVYTERKNGVILTWTISKHILPIHPRIGVINIGI